MKRLVVGLALFAAACSGTTPSSPSGSASTGAAPQATATPAGGTGASGSAVDPTPGGPSANAVVPQFTVTGPDRFDCTTNTTEPTQWLLNVTDAGPRHLRFVALAHQDETPGCGATTKNPRTRIEVSGVTDYTPHSSGQTTFRFLPTMYDCGRVQVDVSIFDAAGNEILVLAKMFDYGRQCEVRTRPICTPSPSNPAQPLPGVPLTFTVSNPQSGQTYSWSAPGATPSSGTGTSFTTQYNSPTPATIYEITPSGAGGTATDPCTVSFQALTVDPICVPAPTNPAPLPGQPWSGTFLVQNPRTGQTYTWAATGGTPASGSGTSFPVTFPANTGASPVTYNVQLSGPGGPLQSAGCTVTLPPPQPPQAVCAPAPENPLPQPGQPWSGSFVVQNPQTGESYMWAAPGGSPSSGSGLTFPVTFPANAGTTPITYNVQLSGASGPLPSQACTVTLPPPPPQPASCAPASTNPLPAVGQPWSGSFNVVNPQTGQTYAWAATGGTPSSGTGLNFPVSFPANLTSSPVTYSVQLSSGGSPLVSTLCTVTLPPVPAPICSPAGPTTALPGAPVGFSVSNPVPGVTYSWAISPVAGGTPISTGPNGTTFSASFAGPTPPATSASYSVTPSIPGGATGQSCQVQVPALLNSCAGTTAVINSLIYPTGVVTITVPSGQQADIRVIVSDRIANTITEYPYAVGPGTTPLNVPIPCFPKVDVFCGDALL
ncbi:MAG: hypothetical protein AB7N65_17540, partial [Vicinamibacterales bacterium]